jgi:hypothetical protein
LEKVSYTFKGRINDFIITVTLFKTSILSFPLLSKNGKGPAKTKMYAQVKWDKVFSPSWELPYDVNILGSLDNLVSLYTPIQEWK